MWLYLVLLCGAWPQVHVVVGAVVNWLTFKKRRGRRQERGRHGLVRRGVARHRGVPRVMQMALVVLCGRGLHVQMGKAMSDSGSDHSRAHGYCSGGALRGQWWAGGVARGRRGVASEMNRDRHAGRLLGHGARDPEALLSVCLEHVGEAKALTAHFARVWLLSSVCAPVALHVGSTGETFPTDLTDERLLTYNNKARELKFAKKKFNSSTLVVFSKNVWKCRMYQNTQTVVPMCFKIFCRHSVKSSVPLHSLLKGSLDD